MNIIFEKIKCLIPEIYCSKYRVDGDFVIAMSRLNEIHYLNEVAKRFFLSVDGKSSVAEIIEKIIIEYDVNRNEFENDIFELIRDLQWKELIVLKEKSEVII